MSPASSDPPSYATCMEVLDDDNDADDDDDGVAVERPPSSYLPFRMHAAVPQFTLPAAADRRTASRRPSLPCCRSRRRSAAAGSRWLGGGGVDAFYQRQKMLRTLRKRTDELAKTLPTFTQVNRIDRLSRVIFPALFILFNAAYWSFYSIR